MSVIKVQRIEKFSKFLEKRKKFMVIYGGRHSGKSFSLAQLFIRRLYEEDNIKMLVLRKTLPALKITAFRLIVDLLQQYQLPYSLNKSVPITIKYDNNEILFGSLDDPEKFKCFTPDTEILTANGFKAVPAIKEGDAVATFNPSTKQGSFMPVSKTWCYNYDGPMMTPKKNVRQRYLDFCVTPDHKMLCRTRIHHTKGCTKTKCKFISVKDIPARCYIPRNAIWDGEIKTQYVIPNIKGGLQPTTFPIIPWLKFLGWYLSEGCLGANYAILLSQVKEEGRKQLKEDLKDFPYKIWVGKRTFGLSGKALYSYLLSLGKYAHDKRIPRDVLNLHPTLLKHIFNTLMKGDGSRTKFGRFVFGSSSQGLIDDVSEIAIKLGLVPTVFEIDTTKPGFYPNAKRHWVVSISKQDETILEKVVSAPYRGKIYGIEVPPYHTVLIRYRGRIMWCGQSYEGNYLWIEEATELSFDEFLKLSLVMSRKNVSYTNQIFLTFNPISCQHWVIKQFVENKERTDAAVMHSTHLDNPFLSDDIVQQIENLIHEDDSLYTIYALGKCGELKNRIYSKYTIGSYPDNPHRIAYGLDFGYNNPTALLETGYVGEQCYERELLYQTHLTNQELIELLKLLVVYRSAPIYADPAEPARIAAIKLAGFNVLPANNSVSDGIDFVKSCHPILDESSPNLISEKQDYKWQKLNGVVIDKPVKFRDHLMAAERYALYTPSLVEKEEEPETVLPRLH